MTSIFEQLKKAGLATDKKQKQIQHQKRLNKKTDNKEEPEYTPPQKTPEQVLLEKLAVIFEDVELPDTSGRRKFHFTTADNFVESIQISDLTAIMLERGKYAIVEYFNDPGTFIVVSRAKALEINAIDKQWVAYLNKNEK